MQWQVWTAFGIAVGYGKLHYTGQAGTRTDGPAADLMFYYVPDKPHITGLNWRLMLGSAGIPALIGM